MMQHVHAGADRLCRERCGGAFERLHDMWALLRTLARLLQFWSLWRYLAPLSGKTPSKRFTKLKDSKILITSDKC